MNDRTCLAFSYENWCEEGEGAIQGIQTTSKKKRTQHSSKTHSHLLCNFLAPNDVLSCQHEMAPLILTLAYEVGAFSAPTL